MNRVSYPRGLTFEFYSNWFNPNSTHILTISSNVMKTNLRIKDGTQINSLIQKNRKDKALGFVNPPSAFYGSMIHYSDFAIPYFRLKIDNLITTKSFSTYYRTLRCLLPCLIRIESLESNTNHKYVSMVIKHQNNIINITNNQPEWIRK